VCVCVYPWGDRPCELVLVNGKMCTNISSEFNNSKEDYLEFCSIQFVDKLHRDHEEHKHDINKHSLVETTIKDLYSIISFSAEKTTTN
jgi:hypothetical protein